MLTLTHISLSFFIDTGHRAEGSSEGPCSQIVCSEPFQNLPVGGVVVHSWQFGQRLPKHLRYGEVPRRVALELTHLYVVLQN